MKRTLKLCVVLASAAVLAGCTQEVETDRDQNRTAIDHATNRHRQNLTVRLTGCLEAGEGADQYVLTQVTPAPLSEQPSDALSSANVNIPENSTVRLSSTAEHELSEYVRRRISVEGLLINGGRERVGTTGQPDTQQPAGDESRAPSSMTPPEIRVRQVTSTGKACQPQQHER